MILPPKDTSLNNISKLSLTDIVEALLYVEGHPFRFISERTDKNGKITKYDRSYLNPMYNFFEEHPIGSKNKIFLCGRQVEKSVVSHSQLLLANGKYKNASDIQVGDELTQLDTNTQELLPGAVTWVSHSYTKECLRIKTIRGHELEVAGTHPIRTINSWTEADKLRVHDKVVAVRNAALGVSSDICWDEITSIIPIGEQDCIDFTVEPHHNYVVDGIVTHNSHTVANIIIALSVTIANLSTLCIFPRHKQLRVFSKQRFDEIVFSSPAVKDTRWSTTTVWQEQMKRFTNGSIVNFNSCFRDGEGVRGNSCKVLIKDELQSLLKDALIVIDEAQEHTELSEKVKLSTATPLSKQNIAAREHDKSCQFEWLVKCDACNARNYLDRSVIGPKSYICKKCGREIYPQDLSKGLWVPMKESLLDVSYGFRVPQIMVPWKTHKELWTKMNDPSMTANRFDNEALGIPTDDGEELISESMLRSACGNHNMLTPRDMRKIIHESPTFSGTDWGTKDSGNNDKKSFTVQAIGAGIRGKFYIYYIEKFLGAKANITAAPGYVNSTARAYGVVMGANDYGFGAFANQTLCDIHGWTRYPEKGAPQDPVLMEVENTTMSRFGTFDAPNRRFKVDRNSAIELFIHALSIGAVVLPKEAIIFNQPLKDFEFKEDFTTIYREYNYNYGTYKYDHTKPDDTFWACLLAYFAWKQWDADLLPQDKYKNLRQK